MSLDEVWLSGIDKKAPGADTSRRYRRASGALIISDTTILLGCLNSSEGIRVDTGAEGGNDKQVGMEGRGQI